jgi:hypothetical protein
MVQLTTEQQVFVLTTYTLTQSLTEVLNYLPIWEVVNTSAAHVQL